MNFTLYPTMLSDGSTSEPFDTNHLPFEITDGVRIEAVKIASLKSPSIYGKR